jgi:hypothetical protein
MNADLTIVDMNCRTYSASCQAEQYNGGYDMTFFIALRLDPHCVRPFPLPGGYLNLPGEGGPSTSWKGMTAVWARMINLPVPNRTIKPA